MSNRRSVPVVAVIVTALLLGAAGLAFLPDGTTVTPASSGNRAGGNTGAARSAQASGGPPAPTGNAAPSSPQPHGASGQALGIGAYAGPGNSTGATDGFGTLIGRRPNYAMDYLDGTSWQTIQQPAWTVGRWDGVPETMVWSVPMLPATGSNLAAGATGAYDQHFVALARFLVAHDRASSVLRLGWGFNGKWTSWSVRGPSQARSYILYWRRIVTAMRSVPGSHFSFEWSPFSGALGIDPAVAWPGREYVSVISINASYTTRGSSIPSAARWDEILNGPYGLSWLAAFGHAHSRPIAVDTWGLSTTPPAGPLPGPTASSGPSSGPTGPTAGSAAAVQAVQAGGGYFVAHLASWMAAHGVVYAILWDYGQAAVTAATFPDAAHQMRESFGRP
ncbi:MAG: glycoside hydrolase family 26 protein [Acidimicrobiales bacterium]